MIKTEVSPNTTLISSKNNKISKTIVFLGCGGVGKTNILTKFTKKRFDEQYVRTLGKNN